MKRIAFLLCTVWCALCIFRAGAVAAYPWPVAVTQPDGSTVTLQLHGDEFYHFTTTADGYTVLQNAQGVWEYARLEGNHLTTTGIQAHDASERSDNERALLATQNHNLTDRELVIHAKAQRAEREQAPIRVLTDLSQFRGLVILVNFSDVQFSRSDAHDFYDHMVNEHNYTGYVNEDGTVDALCHFTGSVRDYFYDQSGGLFDPHFDVVGPVNLNYASTTAGSNYRQIFQSALFAANSQVDYGQYDGDGDGVVDNVVFLVAGWGAHYVGNNSNLLWPHESWSLLSTKLDGVRFDTYACSVEMLASEGTMMLDGIGSFCHEFSHVIGLSDLYDTDGDAHDWLGNGGISHDPGEWDIMAAGNYNNYSRTPPAYSLYERYALGWATPTVLDSVGDYTLVPLEQSNAGYRLNTSTENEFFLIENRQPVKWDAALPGHGMIIARVDSTNTSVWEQNKVNCDPAHNYYELLRAGGSTSGADASDPYPGSMGMSACTNYKLRSWSGDPSPWMLGDIAECDDGTITFTMMDVSQISKLIETFDKMPETTGNTVELEGDIATWKLIKSKVATVDGSQVVSMPYPSNLTMTTPVNRNISRVSFEVHNTATTLAKFNIFYSTDGGATWGNAYTEQGDKNFEVSGGSKTEIDWFGAAFGSSQSVQFRIGMISGSASKPCYVDNFTIYYNDSEPLPGDVNGDGVVDVSDVNLVVNAILGKSEMTNEMDLNGDGIVDVSDVNLIVNIILGKKRHKNIRT